MNEDMNKQEEATVPYYVYEGAMVRAERYFHRLLMALIIALGLIVMNNIAWMKFVDHQYPVEATEETE